jgi:hypothetical protein
VADATLSGGAAGIFVFSTTNPVDDWGGGDVAGGGGGGGETKPMWPMSFP